MIAGQQARKRADRRFALNHFVDRKGDERRVVAKAVPLRGGGRCEQNDKAGAHDPGQLLLNPKIRGATLLAPYPFRRLATMRVVAAVVLPERLVILGGLFAGSDSLAVSRRGSGTGSIGRCLGAFCRANRRICRCLRFLRGGIALLGKRQGLFGQSAGAAQSFGGSATGQHDRASQHQECKRSLFHEKILILNRCPF